MSETHHSNTFIRWRITTTLIIKWKIRIPEKHRSTFKDFLTNRRETKFRETRSLFSIYNSIMRTESSSSLFISFLTINKFMFTFREYTPIIHSKIDFTSSNIRLINIKLIRIIFTTILLRHSSNHHKFSRIFKNSKFNLILIRLKKIILLSFVNSNKIKSSLFNKSIMYFSNRTKDMCK